MNIRNITTIILTSILLAICIACGQQTPDVIAIQTQTASVRADLAVESGRSDEFNRRERQKALAQHTPVPTATPDPVREATAEAVDRRLRREATQEAMDEKWRIRRALTATVFPTWQAEATAKAEKAREAKDKWMMQQLTSPPCKNHRFPPWFVTEISHIPTNYITTVDARSVATQEEIRRYMQWRGSPGAAGCPRVPLPKRMPGDPPLLDNPHWRPHGLNAPTPTPVGWHVYPWRRTPTPTPTP